MLSLLARFLVTPLMLLVAAAIIPGVTVSSMFIAIIVALILGVINITIRPLLLLLMLPITILTLGTIVFVVNGLLLWFVASFIEGVAIDGFIPAFLTALLISAGNWLANKVID